MEREDEAVLKGRARRDRNGEIVDVNGVKAMGMAIATRRATALDTFGAVVEVIRESRWQLKSSDTMMRLSGVSNILRVLGVIMMGVSPFVVCY